MRTLLKNNFLDVIVAGLLQAYELQIATHD